MRTSRSIALSLATLGLMVGLWPAATASGSSGPLPWDGALETIVDFLSSVAAPAVFKVALGGCCRLLCSQREQHRVPPVVRLLFGTGVALLAVRLFNFVLPF